MARGCCVGKLDTLGPEPNPRKGFVMHPYPTATLEPATPPGGIAAQLGELVTRLVEASIDTADRACRLDSRRWAAASAHLLGAACLVHQAEELAAEAEATEGVAA